MNKITGLLSIFVFFILASSAMVSPVSAQISIPQLQIIPLTVTLSVESADMEGSAFAGQWVELWQNGELIQEDFTPFSTDVEPGTEYQVFIYDDPDESKFFDHWDDGSTNPTRTITPLLDTTITAFFQTDTAPTPDPTTGTATITVESADMSGTTFSGQWVELWQNEILLDEGFSPFSVSIDVDTPYEVFIYDDPEHGNFFDHWDDDSTNPTRTIAIASDATITAFFQTDTVNTTQ